MARLRPAVLVVVPLASAALSSVAGCAGAPPKMSFAEAGFPPAIEPEGPVLPPVAVPAPVSIATETPEGPPIDGELVRFAAEARARRARLAASGVFPEGAVEGWRALEGDLDRYLARALPQTPLLELVRARVTVETEWDLDRRRFGQPPSDLAARVASRVNQLARRIETAHALGQGLVPRRAPPRMGWPIDDAALSSTFGMRVDPIDGKRRMHYGIDLAAHAGRAVFVAAKGYVVRAGWTPGYGLMVEVRHPGDLVTRYSHLSKALCAPGDALEPGQALGLVGTTGRVTGPHLHFEVWTSGLPRDPLAWLGGRPLDGAAGN